jgi:hypothetical protein
MLVITLEVCTATATSAFFVAELSLRSETASVLIVSEGELFVAKSAKSVS